MNSPFRSRIRYAYILTREFVISDFKIRYQGSALGYVWALLRPLLMYLVLYVVFFYFLKIGQGVPHWPPALMAGLVIWNFFSEVTKQGLKSIVAHGGIMRKMEFPRYTIIVASSISAVINFLLNMIIVVMFMLFDGVGLSWGFLAGMAFVVELYLFALGLALILATIYVRYRDINFIWDVVTQAMFYGSAVLYPLSRISSINVDVAIALMVNPVTNSIQMFRELAISNTTLTLKELTGNPLLIVAPHIITVLTLTVGGYMFKKRSASFAEEV